MFNEPPVKIIVYSSQRNTIDTQENQPVYKAQFTKQKEARKLIEKEQLEEEEAEARKLIEKERNKNEKEQLEAAEEEEARKLIQKEKKNKKKR